MAYPTSYAPIHRGFLLCHMSPVSCKRSISDMEEIKEPSMATIGDYLQACVSSGNSMQYCLDQRLYRGDERIK
ncbi:unnamed protein product [Adineta steineri]|uniref:Uncharacterized protein n=1 Tax=Adineta steineri TaxID=433720 RepID=A0A815WIC9_9BILA|nr:unnamed protein product [Adineta steineri]CAF1306248.1 unnamed protein product [Adineta steineri]CAF1543612.1 unnamed protein product [Adineta steineri]CAF1577844.1 unnamed protein product [Adineta steineri]